MICNDLINSLFLHTLLIPLHVDMVNTFYFIWDDHTFLCVLFYIVKMTKLKYKLLFVQI